MNRQVPNSTIVVILGLAILLSLFLIFLIPDAFAQETRPSITSVQLSPTPPPPEAEISVPPPCATPLGQQYGLAETFFFRVWPSYAIIWTADKAGRKRRCSTLIVAR